MGKQRSRRRIFAHGAGCHHCHRLEPVGEDIIEVLFNDVCRTASKGCQACWVLSEAVQKCCPSFVNLDHTNVVIKVQRPMLREFVEVIVTNARREFSVTLDLFSEPSTLCCGGLNSIRKSARANVPARSTMPLGKCAPWESYPW